ncbi:MAG: hypothetical protein HQL30_12835, partial [Candidatus Omnitrophica bacterium]|nr:hypothetical protein [Candidatus Omnitrophota bacterium]
MFKNKFIIILLIVSMILETSGMADNMSAFFSKNISRDVIGELLGKVPPDLGKLRNHSFVKGGKAIIHIMDAHGNYNAQHKIYEILRFLDSTLGIDVINLEGGESWYDLWPFSAEPDPRIRHKA